MAPVFNLSTLDTEIAIIYKLEANLLCRMSSRPTKATQKNLVWKSPKQSNLIIKTDI